MSIESSTMSLMELVHTYGNLRASGAEFHDVELKLMSEIRTALSQELDTLAVAAARLEAGCPETALEVLIARATKLTDHKL